VNSADAVNCAADSNRSHIAYRAKEKPLPIPLKHREILREFYLNYNNQLDRDKSATNLLLITTKISSRS